MSAAEWSTWVAGRTATTPEAGDAVPVVRGGDTFKVDLASQYAPLVTNEPVVIPGSTMVSRNSATGVATLPALTPFGRYVAVLPNAGSGDETGITGSFLLPAGWNTATVDVLYEPAVDSAGDFRVRIEVGRTPGTGSIFTGPPVVWTKTFTPLAFSGGFPRIETMSDAATFAITAGQYHSVGVRRLCTDPADTNTSALRIHAVVLRRAS